MSILRFLVSPYDLGRERVGMGRGPDAFLEAGAVSRAREGGLTVEVEETEPDGEVGHEIGATFAVLRAHARRVKRALADGAFPLTLGGNCNTTIATVAGLGDVDGLGVIWFDAHGDANTPDTTTSGFLDGMAMATLAGWCWRLLAAEVVGFEPVPEHRLLHVASRDIDPAEQRLLDVSDISVVPAGTMRAREQLSERFLPALGALASRVDRVYVHIDLDAIDLADGRANAYAAGGGPTLDALADCVDHITGRTDVVAASLTCYDPAGDDDGRALASGLRLLDGLVAAAR